MGEVHRDGLVEAEAVGAKARLERAVAATAAAIALLRPTDLDMIFPICGVYSSDTAEPVEPTVY
jgi:hypothetical protein